MSVVPHVRFHKGYWRVSKLPTTRGATFPLNRELWGNVHGAIARWNSARTSKARLAAAWSYQCECTEVDYCERCLQLMSTP